MSAADKLANLADAMVEGILRQPDEEVLAEAESDTAALALCLACVRALISQGEQ